MTNVIQFPGTKAATSMVATHKKMTWLHWYFFVYSALAVGFIVAYAYF